MKKIFFSFLFLASTSFAGGPNFQQKDRFVQQEFENVYQDITRLNNTVNNRITAEVFDYGAKGDCSTDDTNAIQAAVNTGNAVHFPAVTNCYKITSPISSTTDYQILFGDGFKSKIKNFATSGAISSVFTTSGTVGTVYQDLYAVPASTTNGVFSGIGFKITNSSHPVIRDCQVTDHLQAGIFLYSCDYGEVRNNIVRNGSARSTNNGADIEVSGGTGNTVAQNHISYGAGIGIAIQTLPGGTSGYNTIVDANTIYDETAYGIIAYVAGNELRRTSITNNTIDTIRGSIADSVFGNIYGAGIYLALAQDTLVDHNFVTNTNINTGVNQLAPANIGLADAGGAVISNNILRFNTNYAGITIRDPNVAIDPNSQVVVVGNNISNTSNGVEVIDQSRIRIADNVISTVTGTGISVANSLLTQEGLDIFGNTISSCAGSGIFVAKHNKVTISGNRIVNQSVYGINVDTCTVLTVNNNTIYGPGTGTSATGIGITNNAFQVTLQNNLVTNNKFGINTSTGNLQGQNKIYSNQTNFTGFNMVRALATNNATPDVTDGNVFITSNTSATTLTNFSGGSDGQQILVIVKDANTTFDFSSTNKLRGNGGNNFVATASATVACVYSSDANLWYCQTSTPTGNSTVLAGSTNYIQNTATLQTGSTFYVSSGTVNTNFYVLGNSTGAFLYSNASKGVVTTAQPTNGQLLIGSANSVPVVAALTGTSNQVTVTNGAGTITLATPQNIDTAANVQHAKLGLGKVPSDILDISGVNPSPHIAGTLSGGVTSYSVINIGNTSAAMQIGIESGAGGSWLSGSVANSVIVNGNNNFPLYLATNGTIRETILGGGNVGIGQTSPGSKLHVSGGAITVDGSGGGIILSGQTYMRFGSQTLTQLKALAPNTVGEAYYCSDCVTDTICVSTGTGTGAFSRISARTTACN